MRHRAPAFASPAFEAIARGAQFRDRIAIAVKSSPEAIHRALHEVTLRDMRLAWLLGELRYVPSRLKGHIPAADSRRPFLETLTEAGTLVLHDDPPRELITGSAAQLHRMNQAPRRFTTAEAFDAFSDPDHEKLFMSVRVTPTGRPGEHWLVLEHATLALSPATARKFAVYWRVIKPMGAFVTWQLLRAIRRRAGHPAEGGISWLPWTSVRPTRRERARPLPGDGLILQPLDTLNHAITIRRASYDIWPWLVQMGAGSRGGWYSYDWLDNGRQPSATRVIPELQHPTVGTIFPAAPGMTEGFTLLAIEPGRVLTLGWQDPDGTPEVTWTFVLDETSPGMSRLLVRVRGGQAYRFHGLPLLLTKPAIRLVHFIMQRKQLLGIKRRAESTAAEALAAAARSRPAERNAA